MGMLDGKVAVVTGAGGGIGRATAIALAPMALRSSSMTLARASPVRVTMTARRIVSSPKSPRPMAPAERSPMAAASPVGMMPRRW